MKLFATDVFTPNDFPAYTYVQRAGDDLEVTIKYSVRCAASNGNRASLDRPCNTPCSRTAIRKRP